MKNLLLAACLVGAPIFAEEKPTVDQQSKNEIKATLGKEFTDLANKDKAAKEMLEKIIANNWYGKNFSLVVGKDESILTVTDSKEKNPFEDMREGVFQDGWFGTHYGWKKIKTPLSWVRGECRAVYGEDESLCKMLLSLEKTLDAMKKQQDLVKKQQNFNNSYVESKQAK